MSTKIEWAQNPDGSEGETWNPVRARNKESGAVGHFCFHVSPGCENCYAERLQKRFQNNIRYAAQDRSKVDVYIDEKTLTAPLRWKKPRRIFVCSMTDLFGEWVSDEWIDRVFAVMALAPQHQFQVLSKRAVRMRGYASDPDTPGRVARAADAQAVAMDVAAPIPWPLPNCWKGVSVEDQARADERIPHLLATPAAVRFISAEPLLGPVDLVRGGWSFLSPLRPPPGNKRGWSKGLDWIIVGGESGPNARPMQEAWAESIRDQCRSVGVAFFMKQMAKKAPIPKHLLVREFPS